MLSAATAALLAAPLTFAARADTTITDNTKTALNTTTAGNITIQAGGGVEIKAASAGGDDQLQQFPASIRAASPT